MNWWRQLIAQRWKEYRCKHTITFSEMKRVSDVEVTAPCNRCGKILSAPYGLKLPINWEEQAKQR